MPTMTVVNKAEVLRKIGEIKDVKAKKAYDLTRNDMISRAPRLIAQIGSATYAISTNKLNPNTKGGAGKSRMAAVGGSLMNLQFIYKGRRLTVGGGGATWKAKPRGHRKTPYQIEAQILRGGASPFGHWAKPWSEGGAYGPTSPFMYVGGVQVPVQRKGEKFGESAKGLAVAQVVLSKRTEKQLQAGLETLMLERLEHHLGRILGD